MTASGKGAGGVRRPIHGARPSLAARNRDVSVDDRKPDLCNVIRALRHLRISATAPLSASCYEIAISVKGKLSNRSFLTWLFERVGPAERGFLAWPLSGLICSDGKPPNGSSLVSGRN